MREGRIFNQHNRSNRSRPASHLLLLAVILCVSASFLTAQTVPSADKKPPGETEQDSAQTPEAKKDKKKDIKEETGKKSEPLKTLKENLFHMDRKNRMVPGGTFTITLKDKSLKDDITNVYLSIPIGNGENEDKILEAYVRDKEASDKAEIYISIPSWSDSLKDSIKPKFFTGMFRSHKADLVIEYKKDGKIQKNPSFPIEIPEPFWAWFWAILAVLFATVVTWFLVNRLKTSEEKMPFWKTPFWLATTPANRYSLSLMQVVIWTYVILFGLVFVWKMTQTFMAITPQVLTLLGIGGGTAAAARIKTSSRLQNIPLRYRNLLKVAHSPKVSDLVTTGSNSPSIMKFQMLFFTIFIALNVFGEILNEYSFPVLSSEMVALLGVSSAVYLGNDLTGSIKPEDINAKIKEVDAEVKKCIEADGVEKASVDLVENPRIKELKEMIDAYLI